MVRLYLEPKLETPVSEIDPTTPRVMDLAPREADQKATFYRDHGFDVTLVHL